jgi:phosphoribosylformylglycinamidine cyclo-ligase
VDLRKVRTMQSALGETLGATFAYRAGKKGAPLMPIGHYGGLIDLGGTTALALHTDGVGTKALLAQQMNRFDTIGIDCVAVTVNDLVCLGAEPVALLDYVGLQKESPRLVEELSKGRKEGARQASVSIVGGETAILGDMIKGIGGNGFDLVSMGIALVEKRSVIDGRGIDEGDAILGVESSGLHSNGYTLARKVFGRGRLGDGARGLKSTIGEALLAPTRIYVKPTLRAVATERVHGIAHITGGSFAKLTRLTVGRRLMFDIALPPPPPIFQLLQSEGSIRESEMYRTFNMGIGLCLILPGSAVGKIASAFESEGFGTHMIGRIRKGMGVLVNGRSVIT